MHWACTLDIVKEHTKVFDSAQAVASSAPDSLKAGGRVVLCGMGGGGGGDGGGK